MLQPPKTTRVSKVKMFNRFRNHIGSEGTIRIGSDLKMRINLDDEYGLAFEEDTKEPLVNHRKEKAKKKKAKKKKDSEENSKAQEDTVEHSKDTVASKPPKKPSKKELVPTFTSTLETFYKAIDGKLEQYKDGMTIDLTGANIITVDIETEGLERYHDEIKSIQITDEEENTWVIWVDGNYTELAKLIDFLNQFRVVTHNGKFDSLFLYVKSGKYKALKLYGDTQILAHLLTEPSLKLKDLVKKYYDIDYDIDKETKKSNAKRTAGKVKNELKAWAKENTELTKLTSYNKVITQLHKDLNSELYVENWGQFIKFVDDNTEYDKVLAYYLKVSKRVVEERRLKLIDYGIKDTIFTMRLFKLLREKIKAYKLSKVYKHELRAYRCYIEVEKDGVSLDFDLLDKAEKEIRATIEPLEKILFADKDVIKHGIDNFNSHKQLREFFLDYLGFKAKKKTDKGEWKVDTAQLEEWNKKQKHPIIPTLLEWKVATKQLQFVVSWKDLSQYDGKIHPSFNITAETGRTTCSSPNLDIVEGSFTEMCQNKLRELMEAL